MYIYTVSTYCSVEYMYIYYTSNINSNGITDSLSSKKYKIFTSPMALNYVVNKRVTIEGISLPLLRLVKTLMNELQI